MRETKLTLPEVGFIAATRGMFGAGLGLLLADRLPERRRETVAWTLLIVGAVSTIPLALTVLGRSHDYRRGANRPKNDDASADASTRRGKPQYLGSGI